MTGRIGNLPPDGQRIGVPREMFTPVVPDEDRGMGNRRLRALRIGIAAAVMAGVTAQLIPGVSGAPSASLEPVARLFAAANNNFAPAPCCVDQDTGDVAFATTFSRHLDNVGTRPDGGRSASKASQTTTVERSGARFEGLSTSAVAEADDIGTGGGSLAISEFSISFTLPRTREFTFRGSFSAVGRGSGIFALIDSRFVEPVFDVRWEDDSAVMNERRRLQAGRRYMIIYALAAQADEETGVRTSLTDVEVRPAARRDAPDVVRCGDTIVADVRLPSDLTCDRHGLVVGAPGVEIDLGGHTLSGDGGPDDVGIENLGAQPGLRVRNGTIRGFGKGIQSTGSDIGLRGILVTGNTGSGVVIAAKDGSISNVSATSNGGAGVEATCLRCVVLDNLFQDNAGSGITIAARSSDVAPSPRPSRVEKNRIARNAVNGLVLFALSADATANETEVRANTVSDNHGTGIVVFNAFRNIVTANRISGNATGVAVRGVSEGNEITRNRIARSTKAGMVISTATGGSNDYVSNRIEESGGLGIDVLGANGSEIRSNIVREARTGGVHVRGNDLSLIGNVVERTRVGAGIVVQSSSSAAFLKVNVVREGDETGILVHGTDGVLLGNSAINNAGSGIQVTSTAERTEVSSNVARENLADGFAALSPSAFSTQRNRAFGNGADDCVVVQDAQVECVDRPRGAR